MKKRTVLTYLNFSIVCLLPVFIYLRRNMDNKFIFYSAATIVTVLCLLSLFLLIKRYKNSLISYVGIVLLGLSMIFVVRESLDQRMNFYLQEALTNYLPSASLEIKGEKQYNVNLAKPMLGQNLKNEKRTLGKFYPELPYHQSELFLVDKYLPGNPSVSYRFVFKKPYQIDNQDMSKKACIVWGMCSYFYHGYADIDLKTGEVIGLKIQYMDIK
ncbi:hypothetical protein P4H70_00645 [Paenibacillus ehimensis]|uniref:hypothetical protein n=1 Tax=Paenibacillus ehimensis TaxID=79264 RepID=UPI002DB91486|nr:hypothetical protein [Paenibacillus ehimensis]MEC0207442.1 hypothetical protein [Paenibacillus ehimensis]